MSVELTTRSAVELSRLISSRVISPVDVVEAHLRRIEQLNPSINAMATIAGDAVDRARKAEAEIITAKEVGPLHGLPVTVKDTLDTAGLRTTSGSRLRAHDIPKDDAIVIARLKKAGAIILGKTNTSEMAIPYETDNPVFGRTNNPHDLNRTKLRRWPRSFHPPGLAVISPDRFVCLRTSVALPG
jgi:aspartyl-tRNA(Asn)/glutamyl-tRNA(Gln) amidotransferase subunit A